MCLERHGTVARVLDPLSREPRLESCAAVLGLGQVSLFYLVPVHSAVWTSFFTLSCSSSVSSVDKFLYSILCQFTQQCGQVSLFYLVPVHSAV